MTAPQALVWSGRQARAFAAGGRTPVALLVLAGFVLALGSSLIALRVTGFALDESLIEQSALHYTSNLPHSLFHDVDARATNRLYPLALSFAFRLFGGTTAIRVDHVLSVLMFVSAAAPVYLLARALLDSRAGAAACGALSVAVPWLTLTSALFTENLSYPLFWWAMLAICAAVSDGSVRRDLLAVASIALLICTRVQFVAVFAGYVLAVLSLGGWRAWRDSAGRSRARAAGRLLAVRHPASLALSAGAVAVVLYEKASGGWHVHAEHLLGTYTNVVTRSGLPANMGQGALIEAIALGLGVGLVPAVVSLGWFGAEIISRRRLDRRRVQLLAGGLVLVTFIVLTVYSQGGYLGALTEERYFFYVIPAFWLGAFAALESDVVRVRTLIACTLCFAALYAAIPFLAALNEESAFLAPVEAIVPHVVARRLGDVGLSGLTMQDALALFTLLVGGLTVLAWRRREGRGRYWLIGVPAVLQLLLLGYAYAVIDGRVSGIRGRTGGSVAALGWVDRHARPGGVTWLQNISVSAAATEGPSAGEDQPRAVLFWNTRLRGWAFVPALGLPPVEWPLAAMPALPSLTVDPDDGRLGPPAAAAQLDEVVGESDSPFLQLAGAPLAHSPGGVLTLTRISPPARATWLTSGLQPDGGIAVNTPVKVAVFSPSSSTASTLRVSLALAPAASPPAGAHVVFRLGNATRRITLSGSTPTRELSLAVCFRPHQTVLTGTLASARNGRVAGNPLAGTLLAVTLASLPARAARCS